MNKYTLYFSKYCYFCQKVIFRIKDKEHQIELRSVSEPSNLEELLIGGGKSQVPCLRIEQTDADDTWMYESDDILSYIDSNGLLK